MHIKSQYIIVYIMCATSTNSSFPWDFLGNTKKTFLVESCLVYFSDWFIKWWEVECWLVNRKLAVAASRKSLDPIRLHKKGDTDKKCNICNKVHGTLYCTTDKNRKLVWTFVLKALFVKHCCCCSVEKNMTEFFWRQRIILPEKCRNHFSQLDSLQFFKEYEYYSTWSQDLLK